MAAILPSSQLLGDPLAADEDPTRRLLRGMRLQLDLYHGTRGARRPRRSPSSGAEDEAIAEGRLLATADPRSNHYEVHGEIARGGVGVVLRARDRTLGRDVAIKVLQRRHQDDPLLRRRFVQEARVGARLRHRGIVTVHELGALADGRPFFAMEWVRGETLAAHLDRRQASPRGPGRHSLRRLLDIFEEICAAVAHAHQSGIVHLDLKPSNVMIGDFGEVQVMDWGIAQILGEREEAPPEATRILGTASHMAPEQARGDLAAIDRHTDVFALGGVLLEILSGLPTFVDELELAAAVRCGEADGALARLALSSAPAPLAAVVRACLSIEPGGRPADAAALLRLVRAARALEAPTRPVPTPAPSPGRRARLSLSALAVIVACTLSSLGLEGCAEALRDEASAALSAPLRRFR